MSHESHGSVKEYVTGLILSLVLTFIPFGLAMQRVNAIEAGTNDAFSVGSIMVVILICAIAQLLVQGVFFLHMNGSSSQFWNSTSAIYIIACIIFFVVGSIWIFNHLGHNMLMGH